jgi:Ala-tRNA(Pro) deacylase
MLRTASTLERLAAFLGTDWVTLLTEHELDEILPDCPGGTIPPVPEIARVDVVADEAVRADPQISFHAGSHRTSVRVDRQAWERAAGIRYGSLAMTAEAAVG